MKNYKAIILALGAGLVFTACDDGSSSSSVTCDVTKSSDSVTMEAKAKNESVTEVGYISGDKVFFETKIVFPSTAEADDECENAKEEGYKDIKCSGKNVSYTIVSDDADGVTLKDISRNFESMCVEFRESYDDEDDDDDDDDDDDYGYSGDDDDDE